MSEYEEIAKAFCKRFGYEYIFANEYKVGFATPDGSMWTNSWLEVGEKLGLEV